MNNGINYSHTLWTVLFLFPLAVAFTQFNPNEECFDSINQITFFKRYLIWLFKRWEVLVLCLSFWIYDILDISFINDIFLLSLLVCIIMSSLNLVLLFSKVKFIKGILSLLSVGIFSLMIYFDLWHNFKIQNYVLAFFIVITIVSTWLVFSKKCYYYQRVSEIKVRKESLNFFKDVIILNITRESKIFQALNIYLMASLLGGITFWVLNLNNNEFVFDVYTIVGTI